MNICEEIPNISMDRLITAIGWEYMRTPAYTIKDGGLELANKQKGFQMINPTDKWFPGNLNSHLNNHVSWTKFGMHN